VTGGEAVGQRSEHAAARFVRCDVEDGEILPEAAKAFLAVRRGLAGTWITYVEDAALAQ